MGATQKFAGRRRQLHTKSVPGQEMNTAQIACLIVTLFLIGPLDTAAQGKLNTIRCTSHWFMKLLAHIICVRKATCLCLRLPVVTSCSKAQERKGDLWTASCTALCCIFMQIVARRRKGDLCVPASLSNWFRKQSPVGRSCACSTYVISRQLPTCVCVLLLVARQRRNIRASFWLNALQFVLGDQYPALS